MVTTLRLRDGEREIEVSGGAGFVRQVLEDLPVLLSRLRGDAEVTPSAIRMPSPSPRMSAPAAVEEATGDPRQPGEPPAHRATPPATGTEDPPPPAPESGSGTGDLEERVIAMLHATSHPLPVAAIRSRLGAGITGQQVRRILERAGSRVVATDDRPIRYRLR